MPPQLLPSWGHKNLETARIAYGCQVVEFMTSCVNDSYICGLLLKKYVLDLILDQKQTLMQTLNKVSEFTSCLYSAGMSKFIIYPSISDEKSGPKQNLYRKVPDLGSLF